MAQCRLWANVRMGSDSSHLLLSGTPPLVLSAPGRTSSQVQGRTCRAGAHKLICLEIYSHKVCYGTCTPGSIVRAVSATSRSRTLSTYAQRAQSVTRTLTTSDEERSGGTLAARPSPEEL